MRRFFNLGENDEVPSMNEDSDGGGLFNVLEFLTGSNPGDGGGCLSDRKLDDARLRRVSLLVFSLGQESERLWRRGTCSAVF